jgi:EAL domain-containing protein (putative c-di-GMP-specific phosphodiesterase class I)
MAMLARPRWRIVFQPIRRLDGGTAVGFEALARFPGQLGPIAWIEAAYRFGRIGALDRLLFQVALDSFSASGLPGLLFVNVEAFHLDRVPDWLGAAPAALRPRLVVEVTERDPPPPEGWSAVGDLLHRQRLRLALDDFRCRLAFARHVHRLRPEYVKLDRTLLHTLGEGGRLADWLAALRRHGALLVAEGVHDAEQARLLRQRGINYGQGFGLGRPAPAPDWVRRLRALEGRHAG